MAEFFSNPIWQQAREQIKADLETVVEQVLESVPTVRWRYEFTSSERMPFGALATYKNQNSMREDFLVLSFTARLHIEGNSLSVTSYLDRDNVEDSLEALPDLPDGPTMQIPLPPLKNKSQAEIEEQFNLPSVVSQINKVMLATRSFITSKDTINAIIQEELHR